ncbi:MAG TPA: glucose 1-dehydrogenase [bacterium]|nr:glucose 1-dehydrogenase [bacterium]
MDINLKGKRALITGASSGLGEVIAKEFAACGAKIGLNYHSHQDAAEKIASDIRNNGSEVIILQSDVSDGKSVEVMVNDFVKKWGGIDILVNNAGIDGTRALVWESDISEWERVVKINLFGPFYCAREVLKHMVNQKSGVILNVTSVHENIPWAGYSSYTVAKAGLSMLTKTMAQEVGSLGIRIISLAPGAIKTPINKNVWENPETFADLIEKVPLGRLGEREEVAKTATFLVSDSASYITGSTLFVDGAMIDYSNFTHGG